jgi:hypothetical protein
MPGERNGSMIVLRRDSLTRRTVIGAGLAAAGLGLGSPLGGSIIQAQSNAPPPGWRTWMLKSAVEVRPTNPGPVVVSFLP